MTERDFDYLTIAKQVILEEAEALKHQLIC